MRRTSTSARVLGVLLLLSLVLVAVPAGPALGAPNEIDQRIDELDQMKAEIEELLRQLASKKSAEKSVLAELDKLERQLSIAAKELNYIEVQMSITGDKIAKTRAEVAVMKQKLESQKTAFDSRLVSMYKAGRVSYIDILLTSGSLSEFMSRLHYLRQIAVQDTGLISEYAANHAALVVKQEEYEERAAELTGLKASQELKRAEVTSRSQDREGYLASVQADKGRLEQSLDQMEKEADALNKVIADLQAKGQKPQAHALKMGWPASGGWISSYYGNRLHPILGYYRWHSGVDYAADSGRPILAMEDGTIILAGTNGGYGNCVIIDHGGGVSTLYGHASKILVKKGQDVIKGQTVALVGSTGLSTGPHLHFEVRVKGETQDPLKWLP
ncbi:MAG: peptidoglycan DD-metalloendopeptidase family protein [Bacillota bacterium]